MRDFDVIVVGGGCSGLRAARTAALAGARTLLVERQRRVGARIVCAEGVGAVVGQMTELAPECVAASIDRALLFGPKDKCVELDEPGCGYILNKSIFLRRLAEAAAAAGAETQFGTEAEKVRLCDSGGLTVDLTGAGGGLTADVGAVVAADGIESGIGRRLGIQKPLKALELFSCAQYRLAPVRVDPYTVEFHFGREVAPGGYAWVFPKGEGIANVGVGVICSGKISAPPLDYLERFRQRRCPDAKVLGRVFGGVPTAWKPFGVLAQGVFATGDAARVADPVSGAGIVPGMMSGELAGRAAAACALGISSRRSAEKEFSAGIKALFKDRGLRFAVRKVLVGMSDDEMGRMLDLVGEYASETSLLAGDPFSLVKFMLKAMPRTFGVVRHLVRV